MSKYAKVARRVKQGQWRESHPDYYAEYMRARYLDTKHPCVECGTLVSKKAVRCVCCENRRRRETRAALVGTTP